MHEESGELEIKVFALNNIVSEMLKRQCEELAPDENVGM